jgi:chromosome segregation ATPase
MAEDDVPGGVASWDDRLHADLGGIMARLSNNERATSDISRRLDSFQTALGELSKDLSGKIERFAAAAATRPTNWGQFYSTLGTLGAFALGIGSAVVIPINTNIDKNAAHIDKIIDGIDKLGKTVEWKADFVDYARANDARVTAVEDRERSDQDRLSANLNTVADIMGRLDERTKINHEWYLATTARMQAQLDSLDSFQVKRPEIESANRAEAAARQAATDTLNDRNTSLSARLNSVQDQLNVPTGRVIDNLQQQLRDLQAEVNSNARRQDTPTRAP